MLEMTESRLIFGISGDDAFGCSKTAYGLGVVVEVRSGSCTCGVDGLVRFGCVSASVADDVVRDC